MTFFLAATADDDPRAVFGKLDCGGTPIPALPPVINATFPWN
jgi:hypothetical protein